MSVGRSDIILLAPAHEGVGDAILRVCQRHWPHCVFQDCNETKVRSLAETSVWEAGVASHEFFVFRDLAAVDRWDSQGASEEDINSMLHFLVVDMPAERMHEVTVVCDRVTSEIKTVLADLRAAFRDLASLTLQEAA